MTNYLGIVAAFLFLPGTFGAIARADQPIEPNTYESSEIKATQKHPFAADIRYTSYGVPHIKADTFEGLGFGLAYAFATDNICLMAEQYVTLRGERARYFGTETYYHDMFAESLGERVYNIDSDFFHQLIYANAAPRQKAGAGEDLRKIVTGWVEGYNKYVTQNAGKMPSACNNVDWVTPIGEDDVYRRFLQSSMLGGYGTFMKSIADAIVSIEGEGTETGLNQTSEPVDYAHLARATKQREYGSNAIAFGKDLTPQGRPMMFGNPHFPWAGSERLYQMHLTIPGEYDIQGSALYGIPFPQIGYSKDVAWSLTWSTDIRFLIRELALNKENPTQYLVDGKMLDMEPVHLTIQVKQEDGSLETQSKTAYRTKYGPLLAGQYFKGSKKKAFAIADFNEFNNLAIESYFRLTTARSVADFDANQDELNALPYSNVTGVDSAGTAYYSNKSVAANVTDQQIENCLHGRLAQFYKDSFSVVVLDGSSSACDPANADGVEQPGIIPATKKPSLRRFDYTAQTNDSHWIVNADPSSFISGYGYVVGEERTERGERLRVTTDFIDARATGSDGLVGNFMTPDHMKAIFYQARLIHAELMMDDLIADCDANPKMRLAWSFKKVDVSKACEILKQWDRTESANSVGGHIFREFYRNLSRPMGGMRKGVWKTPFNPDSPLTTPFGLNVSKTTRAALAKAVKGLQENNIPLDARLSDIQFVTRNGQKISFSGGQGFHRISMNFVPGQGYTDPVLTGDSYIMAVSLGEDGPAGYQVNAYSQSTDNNSVHSFDQTLLYGNENWTPIRFSDAEIEADEGYRLLHIER